MNDPVEPLAISPDEASEFYRVLGRALWALGAFEHYLVHYIVIVLRSSFDTTEAAEAELDRAFSFTLGNLMREFRKYRDLAPALDKRLELFKAERDWLCHRIYQKNHTDLLNRRRFVALIQRLSDFKAEAAALHQILDAGFDKWCSANNISQEELQDGIATTFKQWQT